MITLHVKMFLLLLKLVSKFTQNCHCNHFSPVLPRQWLLLVFPRLYWHVCIMSLQITGAERPRNGAHQWTSSCTMVSNSSLKLWTFHSSYYIYLQFLDNKNHYSVNLNTLIRLWYFNRTVTNQIGDETKRKNHKPQCYHYSLRFICLALDWLSLAT